MYRVSPADGPLRQGEIVSAIIEYVFDPLEEATNGVQHDFAVIAAQDCDLERAFEALGSDTEPLNGVLIFPASSVAEGRASAGLNSKIWAHTKINANERYQVLQAISPEFDLMAEGVSDLLIDFRNYFTLSYRQLQHQLENGDLSRRAILEPPYRKHFQARAAAYLSRVAIDPVHQITLGDDTGKTPVAAENPAAPQAIG